MVWIRSWAVVPDEHNGEAALRSDLRKLARHGLRIALLGVAVSLIVGTGLLVANEWKSGGHAPMIGQRFVVGDTRTTTAFAPNVSCAFGLRINGSEHRAAELVLAIRKIDPHALTATVSVALCLPENFLTQLEVEHGGYLLPAFQEEPEGPEVLDPAVYRSRVVVTFEPEVPSKIGEPATERAASEAPAAEPDSLSTVLRRLVATRAREPIGARENSPEVSMGTLTVPLAAAAHRYPFDWYSFRGAFRVALLPAGKVVYVYGPRHLRLPEVPIATHIYADPAIAPFIATAGAEADEFPFDTAKRLGFRFVRSAGTRAYVTVVALIPLLLAVLLAIVLFGSAARDRPNLGPEAVVGLTAVLLAILPIRLVLVPADSSELTLVDYWLGFEVAVLAAMACLAVRRTI
jgi:hypothetical protein